MRPHTVLLAVLLFTAAAHAEAPGFDVNTPFPDVALPDLDGNPRSIAHYRGQRLILQIFASW